MSKLMAGYGYLPQVTQIKASLEIYSLRLSKAVYRRLIMSCAAPYTVSRYIIVLLLSVL
jgi:hypothetical protein